MARHFTKDSTTMKSLKDKSAVVIRASSGAAIVAGLRGDLADAGAAIGVTGEGVEPLG